MFYRFCRKLVLFFNSILFRWNAIGVENIPQSGGVILCCNHISNFDPLPLAIFPERQVHFMAKDELFKIPILSSLIRAFGAFPVKRGKRDTSALKQAISILNEEKILGIFPEGTRSRTGELGKGHTGIAYFALKTKAYVVPAAIIGSYRLFRPLKIVYGKPVDLSEFREQDVSSELARVATDKIMGEIQKIIEENKKAD